MRDTIILAIIVGAITLGFAALKHTRGLGPQFPALNSGATSRNNTKALAKKHTRGAHNEGTTDSPSFQARNSGADEGSADNSAETESLSSIYPKEQSTTSDRPDGSILKNTTAKKKKAPVIAGVPVDAYIASKRNSLSLPDVEEARPEGLRVFLMCSEVKAKKLNPVNERDCGKLYREVVKR